MSRVFVTFVASATFHITGRTRIRAVRGSMLGRPAPLSLASMPITCTTNIRWRVILPAVTASKLVTARLGTVSGTMSNCATVDAFHFDTFDKGTLFLAAARDVTHFFSQSAMSLLVFSGTMMFVFLPPQLEHFGI